MICFSRQIVGIGDLELIPSQRGSRFSQSKVHSRKALKDIMNLSTPVENKTSMKPNTLLQYDIHMMSYDGSVAYILLDYYPKLVHANS